MILKGIMSIIRRHYLNISSFTLIAFQIFNVFLITFYYLPLPHITFLKSREIWIDFPINFYFLPLSFPLSHPISIISNWLSLICCILLAISIQPSHINICHSCISITLSLLNQTLPKDFKLFPDLDRSLPMLERVS